MLGFLLAALFLLWREFDDLQNSGQSVEHNVVLMT